MCIQNTRHDGTKRKSRFGCVLGPLRVFGVFGYVRHVPVRLTSNRKEMPCGSKNTAGDPPDGS